MAKEALVMSGNGKEAVKTNESLTITDNRTGTKYEVPIWEGTIKAMDLRKIKTSAEDFGLMTYDPAFMNTASTKSTITFLDGEKGILQYRGYPIEQLAESCTYLEVAYLVLYGDLARKYSPFHAELPLRCAPHGHVHRHGGGAVYLLPGSEPDSR
jgi:hypothetical protein